MGLLGRLILHPKRRAFLWPRLPVIVQPRGADVGVAKPFLHLGDVGFVIQGIRGGRGPQGMDTEPGHIQPHVAGVFLDDAVKHGRRRERLVQDAERILDRPKHRPVHVFCVAGRLQIIIDPFRGCGVGGDKPQLSAFPVDSQMQHAAAKVQVLDL